MKHIFALFVVLISVSGCRANHAPIGERPSTWASRVVGSELDNFYKVSSKLYRSEQPNEKGFHEIENLGIASVLNLRRHHTDDDEAKGTKLRLYSIKMSAGSVNEDHIYRSLETIKNSKGPILIHCWHGSDRTGVVVAAYRMVFQNWSREAAIDEFINGGYGYHSYVYPNLTKLLNGLDVEKMRSKLMLAGGLPERPGTRKRH